MLLFPIFLRIATSVYSCRIKLRKESKLVQISHILLLPADATGSGSDHSAMHACARSARSDSHSSLWYSSVGLGDRQTAACVQYYLDSVCRSTGQES